MALPLLAVAAIGIGVASIGSDIYHSTSNWNNPNRGKRKRRGPSDYEPASFTVGGTPQPLQPLKPLNTLPALVNLNTLQGLTALQPLRPFKDTKTVYKNPEFNEFTDPLQVNSISDVLFNQEGRNIIMEDLGLDWVDDIPIIGSIAETVIVGADMLVNKYAVPITKGEFGKAFITGMNGLAEDLDYVDLANTVKGFVLEEDKSKVLSRSLGIGSEGKYNYDYDTGNGWKDFGLEVISSPGTWVTLVKGFIAAGVKNMAKTAIKESAERIARETGADLTSEYMQSLIKRTARIAGDTALDSGAANELVQELLKEYVATSISKNSVDFSQQFLKQFNKDLTTVAGSRIMTALKTIKPVDAINDQLSMLALKTYITGGTYPILSKTYDPIIAGLKNTTLKGLSKVTKKGVDVLSAVFPKDETILDLTKVVDNATIKEITQSQFRTTKIGRLKYGDQLDRLKAFGGSEEFDRRLIGMMRSLSDVELPEDKFFKIINMLEEDVKAGRVIIDVDWLRTSPAFRDFVIGTATESGYILKTASALDTVQDALNKNFKYVRRDILNELAGSKTNLDAFIKLENYFKTQGLTLKEMLERLDELIADLDVDNALYAQQKEFLENLMDGLGFNRAWLSEDTTALSRALNAVTGSEKIITDTNGVRKIVRIPYENTDEMLAGVLKEIDLYKVRGHQMMEEANAIFEVQKRIYSILSENSKYVDTFNKMLGDTTLSQVERNALEQVIKALESDSPMNSLFKIMDVLTGTPLEDSFLYDNLSKMVNQLQQEIDVAVGYLERLELEYTNVLSEYKYSPEQVAISKEIYNDYRPDAVYKRLKDLNFTLKALGNEHLETVKYLRKLTTQPNIIKAFDNPIKPTELGKALDKITFKNAEDFFADLKRRGVARNIIEDLKPEDLEHILARINTVDEGLPNTFERLQQNIMEMLYSEDATEELLTAGFKDSGISNIQQIVESMREVNSFYDRAIMVDEHLILQAKDLSEYMDSIENLTDEISRAARARASKETLGETLFDTTAITGAGDLIISSKNLTNKVKTKINEELLSRGVSKQTIQSLTTADYRTLKNVLREKSTYIVVESISSKLDALQTMLQENYVPLFEYVNLSGDNGKIYRLKLLQFFNRVENINKLRDTVYQGQSTLDIIIDIAEGRETIIGGLIDTIANGEATDLISDNFRGMARQIQNRAQSTVNYLKLQDAIYSLDTTHGLNDAVMDWLENFNRKKGDQVVITREALEEALVSRTELGKATGAMKLENYYEANVKHAYDDVLKAHNAVDDREMQIRVLQHQLDKGYKDLPEGKTFVSFDIETTGLSLKQVAVGDADVVQISAARYQVQGGRIVQIGQPFEAYAKPRRTPTKDIVDLLGEKTLDIANASDKTTQQIVDEFLTFVGNDTVSGHNIENFDIPYLKEVSNYKTPEILDTYQIMRDTEFKSALYSDDNVLKFQQYVEDSYNIIQQYAIKQQTLNLPFICTIDKFFADDLFNLFNPLDYHLQRMDKRGLNALSHGRLEDARSYILGKADSSVDYSRTNLPEGTDTFDATRDGTSMIQTLRQGLTDTTHINRDLSNWYIPADALEREFGTTNIFAVMHGTQDGRYVDEFLLNKYGVKTMWKPQHINILNNLPENVNVSNAVQVEKFRTTLDRVYERIYNNYSGYTTAQIAQMKELILQDFGKSMWLGYTNLDTLSMYELWALYQTLGFYNIEGGVLKQGANYEVAKGIMSNAAIRDDIKDAILYVDDIPKLQDSYGVLEDSIFGSYSEKQVDDALSDLLANGSVGDTLRAIAYMERDYTAFVKDSGTFDEDWYARLIRKEFETNYTVLGDARRLVDAKRNIEPTVFYQYQRLNKQRYVNHTKSVLGLNPKSLTKYMHEHGFVTYLKGSDVGTFADEITRIVKNKKIYEAAGISFKQTDDTFILYLNKNYENLYPDMVKDVKYKTNYRGVIDKTTLDDSMRNYLEAFEKNDLRIKELDSNPFDAYNSVYNKVDGTRHHDIIKDLDLPDLVSETYKSNFYTRVSQIDFPVIGTTDNIRSVDKYAITDMVNSQIRELNRSLKLSGARNKYIQFLFNDDYTLKRNALWDKLSDEQVLDILKDNKKLSAVVLYEKDGKVMARKVSPTTVGHIDSIRNLNGGIFPTDMANKITGTINEYDKILKENHPILYKWREYVVSTYKTLYLTSLGFLFRNGLDIIIKNTTTLEDGPVTIPKVMKYNMQAWRMWDEYSKTIAKIIADEDGLTEIAIAKFFRNNPQLNRETFEFVHRYATSSASAGMAKAQQDMVKSFNLNKHSVKTNVYKKAIHDNYLVRNLMEVNAHIEHSGRLGLLLQSIEEGKLYDNAIQDVLRTHFDYSNLSYGELLAETIIPFVTFPIRNLEYWNDALKGNMWLVELMLDATTQTTQMHSQTQFMIDNSSALQNDLMNGNVRVLSSVIKTSPSVFDAAMLFLSPADMISDYTESDINRRIIAPLRMPRDKDTYGNVSDSVTKRNEYLRNVLAIYQIERPVQVLNNLASLAGAKWGYESDLFQIKEGNVDNPADVIPSIVKQRYYKVGNMTGDMRMYQRMPNGMTLQSVVGAGHRQDANREQVATKLTMPKQNKPSRVAYSKQRIPYTKRYYSSSYNFYNRWKAQSTMRTNAARNLPPTPESLQYAIRNVFFSNNITPLKMNYLQFKQRSQLR